MLAWIVASLAGLAALAVAGRRWRRGVALGVAMVALVAAALDARVGRARMPRVAALVDCSPSARGQPRDRATIEAIARRLAPDATLDFLAFADGLRPLGDAAEIDVARTRLPAVDADATLLFSDGRFAEATPTTPTYPIVFEDDRRNARIVDARGDRDRTLATIANNGGPRTLTWPNGATTPIGRGTVDVVGPAIAGTLALDAGDRWPENDRLDVAAAPAADERWWVGDAAPAGFRALDPRSLPPAGEWLAARLVVLSDVPAAAIAPTARESLTRYVRDLGGAVLFLGGPHAFSAGGYAGTELDALSPLASAPPTPRDDWYVLVDASGSMAQATPDGRSRLDVAAAAAAALDGSLPASARVVAGSVARDVRWWPAAPGRRIAPPADLIAGGPTNLDAAIRAIAARAAAGDRAARLLVISDGQATFADAPATIAACRTARLSVDWLALGDGPLASIVAGTDGSRVDAGAPAEWLDRARATAGAAQALPLRSGPIVVRRGEATTTIDAANATFPRDAVEPIAAGGGATLAATWLVGLGRVTAVAFAPPSGWIEAFARASERAPRDPRFVATWSAEAVTVDALDPIAGPTDGLELTLAIDGRTSAFAQVAPGLYRAAISRGRWAEVATIVTSSGTRIDARALPGRYDAEFAAVGTDRAALDRLAARTGGRVARADERGPIAELPRPRAAASARGPLLGLGLIAIVATLLERDVAAGWRSLTTRRMSAKGRAR